jgi:hypothetical protein
VPHRLRNRNGAVEKANHSAAQRWWRTLPDDRTSHALRSRVASIRWLDASGRYWFLQYSRRQPATILAVDSRTQRLDSDLNRTCPI